MLRVAAHEVEEVAVGRESQSGVAALHRRHDLRIAAGGDVPHPQALLALSLVDRIDHIFAIRGNGCQHHMARVGQLLHAHVLERNGAGIAAPLSKAGVEAIDPSANHQQADRQDEIGATATPLVRPPRFRLQGAAPRHCHGLREAEAAAIPVLELCPRLSRFKRFKSERSSAAL